MRINEKINVKIYSALSSLILIISLFLCRNYKEYLVILSVYVAVILNQWLLVSSVDSMVKDTLGNEKVSKGNLIISLLLKALIVVIAISFGVHIMGNRIIIPVIIYILQIFVLYFSLIKRE
jgi:hypothetical protein